jgi:release factor glutamine methyltransferase
VPPEAPSVEVPVSVRTTIDRAARRLAAAGIEAPRREATRLVTGLLGASSADWWTRQGEAVSADQLGRIEAAVARRAAGEPLAYLIGSIGFRHLMLRVDGRALIPRPETEGIVDRALALQPGGRAVDVGTGTGCLALSLRLEGGFRSVVALDRSEGALALAERNRRHTGLAIELARGDLTDSLATDSVDLIVSNPPYLSVAEYRRLDPSVREHEPSVALVGGEEGIELTRALLDRGRRVMRLGGWIVLELESSRAAATAAIAVSLGWQDVRVEEDFFGRPRYLAARLDGGRNG